MGLYTRSLTASQPHHRAHSPRPAKCVRGIMNWPTHVFSKLCYCCVCTDENLRREVLAMHDPIGQFCNVPLLQSSSPPKFRDDQPDSGNKLSKTGLDQESVRLG